MPRLGQYLTFIFFQYCYISIVGVLPLVFVNFFLVFVIYPRSVCNTSVLLQRDQYLIPRRAKPKLRLETEAPFPLVRATSD